MNVTKTLGLSVLAAIIMMTVCLATVAIDGDDTGNYTEVTDETSLTNALKDTSVSEIRIMNDFEISNPIVMYRLGVTLDGRNHVLTCNKSMDDYMLKVIQINCTLKNIALDSNDNAKGVCLYHANGTILSNVILGYSTGAALTVDMSNVKISAPFSMQYNGELVRDTGRGNYIALTWSESSFKQGKCSVVFDSDKALYRYDGINASIKPIDLQNAGVTKDNWKDRFEVKYGTDDLCEAIYGTSGHETILLNNGVAQVGEKRYAALRDAVVAGMKEGKTVELTQDCVGGGFVLPENHKELTMDLKGYSYRILDPQGTEGNAEDNFLLAKGGKVSILDGTIFGNDPDCYNVVEAYCDLYLEKVEIDAVSIRHEETTNDSDTTYALKVVGATCTLNSSSVIGKDASNFNRSYILDGATLITMGEQTTIYGDSVMDNGSKLIANNDYFEPFGVRGRSSEMFLNDGTIYIKQGAKFSADVYSNNRTCEVNFEEVLATSDSVLTSGDMTLVGSFSGNKEFLGSIGVNQFSRGGSPVYLDIIIGDRMIVDLDKDVRIMDFITMLAGSELRTNNVSFGSDNEAFIILTAGCTVDDVKVEKDTVLETDSGSSFKQVLAVLFVPVEHVKGFTVDGKESYGMTIPIDKAQRELDLSKIIVNLDDGYQLTGWYVNGVEYRLCDTVVLTGHSVLEPIISEKTDDNYVMAFMVIIIALALLAIVVPFGTKKKQ